MTATFPISFGPSRRELVTCLSWTERSIFPFPGVCFSQSAIYSNGRGLFLSTYLAEACTVLYQKSCSIAAEFPSFVKSISKATIPTAPANCLTFLTSRIYPFTSRHLYPSTQFSNLNCLANPPPPSVPQAFCQTLTYLISRIGSKLT